MMTYWKALNDKLTAAGLPEALYREVTFYRDHKMTIDEAFRDLKRAAS